MDLIAYLINLFKNPPSKMAYIADIVEYKSGVEMSDTTWALIGDFLEPRERYIYQMEEYEFQQWYRRKINEIVNSLKNIKVNKERLENLTKVNKRGRYKNEMRNLKLSIKREESDTNNKLGEFIPF